MSTIASTAKLRLRHPKGSSTLEVDLASATVQDLQRQISAISNVLPAQQDLKSGYPPRQLPLAPDVTLTSLGLKAGDQIILTQKAGSSSAPSTSAPFPTAPPLAGAKVLRSSGLKDAPMSGGVSGLEFVNTNTGVLIHRVVPDDNSCLFSCVALIFEQDICKAQSMRKIVAEAIQRDAETWSEAMLGIPRERYIQNILKPSTWGGAIELSILATHYSTEIASVDVETGRIDRFSPSTGNTLVNRCIVIYSGIHYDTASLAPMVDAPPDFHQTVYPIEGEDVLTDSVLSAASKLADKLRAKRAYTNTATFDLRCEVCKVGLKGEKGARDHAMQTGHTAFGEY